MTTKPILYYHPLSPPSRSVLLTAKEIGLELDLKIVNLLKGEHLTPEFIKINPQHTVPTLDDNNIILYDSHVICSYLIDKYAKNDNLFPKDMIKRYQVETKLHFDSGFLFPRLRFLYEPILYYGSTDCSDFKIKYIQKTYEIMEAFLEKSSYLCGNELTIADFCCIATISSIDEIAPIDSKYSNLLKWYERISSIPYYKEVNQKGADELKNFFKTTLAKNQSHL